MGNPEFITAALLCASLLTIWIPRLRNLWLAPFALAISVGIYVGSLSWLTLIPITLLLIVGITAAKQHKNGNRMWDVLSTVLLALISVAMGLHLFPGFERITIIPLTVLGTNAIPYAAYFNLDKLIAGILIVAVTVPTASTWQDWREIFRKGAPIAGANAVIVSIAALALGYVALDPKWTSLFWVWLGLNLITCITEEALFRGFLLPRVSAWLSKTRHANYIAVGLTAVLFGVAHIAGGPIYVLLSTIAGVGYGMAYIRTGRIEAAILAHLTLNTVHFLFLTYPKLA